jgi:hypothetical protein
MKSVLGLPLKIQNLKDDFLMSDDKIYLKNVL